MTEVMEDRPEWVSCIQNPYLNTQKSMCGRDTSFGFSFKSIDHACRSIKTKGRMMICPECSKQAIAVLKEGTPRLRKRKKPDNGERIYKTKALAEFVRIVGHQKWEELNQYTQESLTNIGKILFTDDIPK